MEETEYFLNLDYQKLLISNFRKRLTPPEKIFRKYSFEKVENILDFGMGLGFFTFELRNYLPNSIWLWGVECQQNILDLVLYKKTSENIKNFTPFFMERNDHPILPKWIPEPDIIFASFVLSTFPNLNLVLDGLAQSLKPGGKIILIDWMKTEGPKEFNYLGPKITEKISLDKIKYIIEETKLTIKKEFIINSYAYSLEITPSVKFEKRFYDLKEEENNSED